MKTLQFCIRCHSLRDGDKKFNSHEVASIYICRKIGIAEIRIEDCVCHECRQGIGDAVADKMLEDANNLLSRLTMPSRVP